MNTNLAFLILVILFAASCRKDDLVVENSDDLIEFNDTNFVASDWTLETHSKQADPDFDEVFNDAVVKRLDFVISESRWQLMLDDMTSLYGTFGSSRPGPPGLSSSDDPIFVPADVFYNGKQWYRVGIRFKGNSSLQTSWQQGILKLSFKMDFDEFEDEYPQIDNQRFYGFKKFSLKNNYDDKSFMRDKVAAKVFENAGMAVSHTAFYTLYIDHGDGPEYFGLYTLVEEVDNTVIKTQFIDDGNLYKPENTGASFAYGTFNEADFEKKTNEDDGDWTDIQALFSALHNNSRNTNAEEWRSGLDAVFNTDAFLKYLAINTVIQNWDSYGIMTQNYYLYNDPSNSKLTWIPWDMNESLQEGKNGGALALDFSDLQTGGKWPLIEYLYNDPVYKAIYDGYVAQVRDDYFEVTRMQNLYSTYSDLIESYAISERYGYSFLNSAGEFQIAVNALNQHVSSRAAAVNNYLD